MPEDRSSAEFAIDPAALVDALNHHRKLILAVALFVFLLALVASFLLPPRYQAQAKIFVQDSIAVGQFQEQRRVQWTIKERMPLIETVVKSKSTLRRVLETLGEIEPDATPADIDLQTEQLAKQLSLWQTGRGLVTINMQDTSSERVFQALKMIVDEVVNETLRPQRETLLAVTEFLEGQLTRVRDELGASEARMQAARGDQPEHLPEVAQIYLASFKDLQRELLATRAELAEKRSALEVARGRNRGFDPAKTELRQEIEAAAASVARLETIYTDNHPKLSAARSQLKALKRSWSQRKSGGRGGKKRRRGNANAGIDGPEQADIEALRIEVGGLKRKLAELDELRAELLARVAGTTELERELERHRRDNEVAVDVYKELLTKYEEALVNRELALFDEHRLVWIVDPPQRPTRPSGTPRIMLLLAAFVGGIFLGCGFALAADFVSDELRSPAELRGHMPQTVAVVAFPDLGDGEHR